jgi:hypothetical protein
LVARYLKYPSKNDFYHSYWYQINELKYTE